jgi:hypothetical protein
VTLPLGSLFSRSVLGIAGFACAGCLAEIREERIFGPARTTEASKTEIVDERRDDGASGHGSMCRDVALTSPIVRDVTIRRYFADDAQTRNGAMATLLGTGIALLAYGASQSACSAKTGCPDFAAVTTGEFVLLALSAIPIGFIGYNAVRAQDGRTVDYVTPRWTPGAWAPCPEKESASRTMLGEP